VITADPVCVTVFVVVSLHSWPIDVVHCFFSVFNNKCNMVNAWSAHALLFACDIFYAEFAQLMVSVRRTYDAIRRFLCSVTCLLDRPVCKRVETRSSAVAEKAPCIQIQVRVWIRPWLLLLVYLHVFWKKYYLQFAIYVAMQRWWVSTLPVGVPACWYAVVLLHEIHNKFFL